MGLAASQARLLSLTARIHDVEYQAQMIQSAKLALALQEDEVYRKYNEALDATTLTFQNTDGQRVQANFNNLCGLGSIDNKIAGNKNYVFRDNEYNLLIPSEIYNGYAQFGGDDPYSFALFMLMGDGYENKAQTVSDAQQLFFNSLSESDAEDNSYASIKEQISNIIQQLFKESDYSDEGSDVKSGYEDIWVEQVLRGDFSQFTDINTEKGKELLDKLKEKAQEYKFQVFRRDAETIYGSIPGCDKDDFDKDKFNYYLRWGKLLEMENVINREGNLIGCTDASVYGENMENDPELLNQMLQSGRISVDMVSIDYKTGKVSDDITSPSSDSNLAYTNKSSIDQRELKKAEAEYEHAMKQINKKDKQYDMDLNRLETERNALTTEYDSVKQVIKDNIERTFGIFS